MLNILLAILVSATIDSTQISIGDQCHITLNATTDSPQDILFPSLQQTLIPDIEILQLSPIDTTTQNQLTTLSQTLTITSFQDSLFLIPPFQFTTTNNDTLLTNSLTLNVIQPFVIDSTNAITDIKPIMRAPIYWWGIILLIIILLIIAGLAVGAYFLYKYIRSKQNTTPTPLPQEPTIPANILALQKLEEIKQQKIWQQGRHKEYHTLITDALREYIAAQFQISSQEQTSTEILLAIKPILNDKQTFSILQSILTLADLVKFAKYQPLPDENITSINNAINFITQTTNDQRPTTNDQRLTTND